MGLFENVKNRILGPSDMDYVGICPSSVLEDEPAGHRPSDLLPNAKSIIVFGRRLISGSVQSKFRYFEDGTFFAGSSYSAHSFVLSINHLCMKETYDIAQYLEKTYSCYAMPLTNNVLQAVEPEGNALPFFADPCRAGLPIDIYKAAVAAGIGEMGWSHRVLTPDCGPRIYLCAIVTSLAFERYDSPYSGPRLCNPAGCRICSQVCPTHALSDTEADTWKAAGCEYQVGKRDINSCAVASFGFTRKTNLFAGILVESEHPDDGELAAALERQYDMPGMQTLDHVPMYHCEKCLIYCPVGNWSETFRENGLTKGVAEE